jgi:hypothetical protein
MGQAWQVAESKMSDCVYQEVASSLECSAEILGRTMTKEIGHVAGE